MPDRRLERTPSPPNGAPIGSDDRRRDHGALLASLVRCPACRTTQAIDLRKIDRHRDAAVTSLIPALSCRGCRPNAPFAELVRLSQTSTTDEMRIEHTRRMLGD